MSFERHAYRVILIMAFAAGLLGWTAARTPVIWADGLRYIGQAKEIERGLSRETLSRAVDHPIYPAQIASIHRLTGGASPKSWQFAAQLAAVVSGVLLVIPLYLVALELFGESVAWVAALITFLVPIPGHVMADALSESTFLLIWTWGVWFAFRFLRQGNPVWLIPIVVSTGLAYLTRPEGLLLPVALVATLCLMPLMPSIRFDRARWWIAVSLLVIGPVLVAGPFILLRGGVGTKPAVARLLGLAAKAPGMAIERDRPIDEKQAAIVTLAYSVRAMFRAVTDAVTPSLLLLAPLGFVAARHRGHRRSMVFLGVIVAAWMVALVRLYATGGYCTPRHSLIASLPLIAAGAAGLVSGIRMILDRLERHDRLLTQRRVGLEALAVSLVLGGIGLYWSPETLAPLNRGYLGYRQAGDWLATHTDTEAVLFDLKGWATFYSDRPGYGFARIGEGAEDRNVRWLVAHDALLTGPWFYCDVVRNLVQGRKPVESFPKRSERGVAQVHIFDLRQDPETFDARVAAQPEKARERR